MAKRIGTQVITNKVRFSYAHVFVPSAVEEGQKKKYGVSLLISKDDTETLKLIDEAIKEALEKGKAKHFGGQIPTKFKEPLRDGDEEREDDEVYENCFFVNANSDNKPTVIDIGKKEIMLDEDYADRIKRKTDVEIQDIEEKRSEEEFYSGCYGRASINFYAFGSNVPKKGIACGLNNLQKIEDGEDLGGGRTTANEDFGDDLSDLM